MDKTLHIVGGGMAGSEAAWQAARMGVNVVIHEMRPTVGTFAHRTGDLAEMVWAVIDFHFYRMIRDARLTPGRAKAKAKRPTQFPGAVSLAGSKRSDEDVTAMREFCRATIFARFLQDGPPNYIRPEMLAEIAQDMAQDNNTPCEILDRKAMQELKRTAQDIRVEVQARKND